MMCVFKTLDQELVFLANIKQPLTHPHCCRSTQSKQWRKNNGKNIHKGIIIMHIIKKG